MHQQTNKQTHTLTQIHGHAYTTTRHDRDTQHTTSHTWCYRNVYALALEFLPFFIALSEIYVKPSTVWPNASMTHLSSPHIYVFAKSNTEKSNNDQPFYYSEKNRSLIFFLDFKSIEQLIHYYNLHMNCICDGNKIKKEKIKITKEKKTNKKQKNPKIK